MSEATTDIRGRKSDVLEAAAALFADRGYSAISVDEIGERAGITGPGIYNHFDGKEALLAAVILNAAERLAQAAETAVSERTGDARKDLRRLVDTTVAATFDLGDAPVVYVREAGRLRVADLRAVRRADERLLRASRELVFEVAPDLSDRSFVLRSALVSGAVTAGARLRTLLPRRALDKVMSDAVFAVLSAPAPADQPQQRSNKVASWAPPPTRRDEIFATAMQLFAERSYHDVSMEDIGAEAGISAAAIYRHFASKADIATEAFMRVGSRVVVGMERALVDASTPADALRGLVHSLASTALEASDLVVVAAQTVRELTGEDIARERRTRGQLLDTWTHVLRAVRPELKEVHTRVLAQAGISAVTQAAQLRKDSAPPLAELEGLTLVMLNS
jgi:AcrR family transcriptional regulator